MATAQQYEEALAKAERGAYNSHGRVGSKTKPGHRVLVCRMGVRIYSNMLMCFN